MSSTVMDDPVADISRSGDVLSGDPDHDRSMVSTRRTPAAPSASAPAVSSSTDPGPDAGRLRVATGWLGAAATGLGLASLVVLALGPRFGEPGATVVDDLAHHSARAITGPLLGAVASVAAVAWFAGLRQCLDRRDPLDRLRGDLALLGAVLLFGLVLTACGSGLGLAVAAGLPGGVAPDTAALVSTTALVLIDLSAIPTVLIVAALFGPLRRAAWVPGWAVWLMVAVGLAHVGASLSVAGDGVLAVDGLFAVAAPFLFYTWSATLSVALLRSRA